MSGKVLFLESWNGFVSVPKSSKASRLIMKDFGGLKHLMIEKCFSLANWMIKIGTLILIPALQSLSFERKICQG